MTKVMPKKNYRILSGFQTVINMKNYLFSIIRNKRKEVKEKYGYRTRRGFFHALSNPGNNQFGLIAEIKIKSPTEGVLGRADKIKEYAINYQTYGADAISIVVDNKYFGGRLKFIDEVKRTVTLPVLAKDFIIDASQIYEMRLYGADAVLLIAKIISGDKLRQFVDLCNNIGLDPVVEVGNEKELRRALKAGAEIIGVNARNLDDFSINREKACGLIKLVPKNKIIIGFSGINSRGDVQKYLTAGAGAVLIGTRMMKAGRI